MDVDIRNSPAFALAAISLPPGAEVSAEGRAMMSMTGGVEIETSARGGLLSSLKRTVFGGESFFINTFRAPAGGELMVAPTLPGDIVRLPLDGSQTLFIRSGSWLASDSGVDLDTKWAGAKGFFAGNGLFLLRCSGNGDALVASYGAIERRDIAAGEVFKVDTGHVVAFEEGIDYRVAKVGGWKSTILSGEGLVASFTGPGTIWIQSRSSADFLSWLIPQLPTSSGGSDSNGF